MARGAKVTARWLGNQLLADLAAIIRETELARLATLAADRRQTESRMAELRIQRADVTQRPGLDAARLGGADAHWLEWSNAQLQDMSSHSAQAAAQTEAQIAVARRAFQRADVLNRLAGATKTPSQR